MKLKDMDKLRKYYIDIMKAVYEIKKITTCAEKFWEQDIHY